MPCSATADGQTSTFKVTIEVTAGELVRGADLSLDQFLAEQSAYCTVAMWCADTGSRETDGDEREHGHDHHRRCQHGDAARAAGLQREPCCRAAWLVQV